MGRQKRDGNYSAPKNKLIQNKKEMKKVDIQIQTPPKQR
jgi:hypothetical protein